MVRITDQLADQTGLGEAITGAIFLGGVTSLPGLTASVAAAWTGHPEMAVSNALGGLQPRSCLCGLRRFDTQAANLEHTVASVTNLYQGTLLIRLLALPLLATNSDTFSGWVDPPGVPADDYRFLAWSPGGEQVSLRADVAVEANSHAKMSRSCVVATVFRSAPWPGDLQHWAQLQH